jgi:hypothetical protein
VQYRTKNKPNKFKVMTTKVTGTKKNSRTVVSVTKYSDAAQTIQTIDAKLEQLRLVFNTNFRTNGDTKTSANPGGMKINQITTVGLLIAIMAEILAKKEAYDRGAEFLGLNQFPSFIWQGYGLDSWTFDIKLRIAQIEQSKNESELVAIKTDLQEFMTKEDRLALLTERLSKLGL